MKLFRLSFAAAVLGVTLTACGTSSPTAPVTASDEISREGSATGQSVMGTGARSEPDPYGGT